jgi:YihY family inner membrane protein
MDAMGPIRRFDRVQQRHKGLAVPIAVIKKFGDDQAGSLAALVAYYAFFSLFPLLLVFLTVLGFVLQGDASAQESIRQSVLGQFPIVGQKLDVQALHGSPIALAIGLLTSLWAGLGVTSAARNALDRIWAVPFKQRPGFAESKVRGVLLLFSLGALFIVATLASGLVTGGLGHSLLVGTVGIVFSLALNISLFFASFRLMTTRDVTTRELRPGAILAGIMWTILQALGGYYIGHVLKSSHGTYAQFGFVIALLIWLHLGAQMTLYAAEVNVVLTRRLWPRSLFGPPQAPADQRTLRALAKVEERSEAEHIDVEFKA